ncbi:MAG TPA: ABC transporter substrate-binding protein [Bryobacteraceae bacterium]|jgi:iron complex transport system substrate-binding protein|nr:ABC transporter substrate-binding protein [Bryobacteraceae bacterium]
MRRAFVCALCLALCAAGADVPRRIVSLSPDLTEMLYGVGAFSHVVAVSDFDNYPPQAAKLPRLGQLNNPSFEQLTALRPDLVVITDVQAPFLEETLKQLGFRVLKISNQSIQEVYDAILAIGRATGNESEAAKLVASTRERLDRVGRKTTGLPKPRVVMIVDRTPGTLRDLYTATSGSYLAQLVEIAGGRIAVAPAPRGYAKLSKEDLLAANPDIILDFVQGANSRFATNPIKAWQEMPELKAVREHRVYAVNEDFVPHASQRIVQTAELFARLIHPELQ